MTKEVTETKTSLPSFNMVASVEILGKEINLYNSLEVPLFLAKDVAEWIDYAKTGKGSRDVSKMIKTVDEDEKLKGALGTKSIRTQASNSSKQGVLGVKVSYPQTKRGGLRKNTPQWFLTEDGLYEVCMQSTKPEAKKLKKQIKKYLRDIRKTGGAVEYGSEAKFIEERFSRLSDETKKAMMAELLQSNEQLLEENLTLESDVKALKTEILTWDDRKKLNAGVRMLASKTHHYFGTVWNMLYKELQYKHGICLTNRAHGRDIPLISLVKKNEWGKVMESFNALCVEFGQSPSKMFQQVFNKS